MAEFTQAQLDAIRKAYANGALVVQYDGNRVEYRSLADMERIIAKIEKALNTDSGKTSVRAVRIQTGKGFS